MLSPASEIKDHADKAAEAAAAAKASTVSRDNKRVQLHLRFHTA